MDSDGDAAAAFETKAGSEVSALPWLQQARACSRCCRRCRSARRDCVAIPPTFAVMDVSLPVQRLRCPKLLATNNFKKKVSRQVV
jgi:ABC-type antimicrobial peptide transport system ATPase subunit